MKLIRNVILLIFLILFSLWALNSTESTYEVTPLHTNPESKKINKKEKVIISVKMVAVYKPTPPSPPSQKLKKKETPAQGKKAGTQKKKQSNGNKKTSGRGQRDLTIIASFAHMDVADYLACMEAKGACIAVYDRLASDFVCRIRPNGAFAGPVHTAGMSSRARTLTADFPGSKNLLEKVNQRFGPSQYEIVLLMPEDLDARFQQNIKNAVSSFDEQSEHVLSVWISYQLSGKNLRVSVERIETKNDTIKVNKNFFL